MTGIGDALITIDSLAEVGHACSLTRHGSNTDAESAGAPRWRRCAEQWLLLCLFQQQVDSSGWRGGCKCVLELRLLGSRALMFGEPFLNALGLLHSLGRGHGASRFLADWC